MVKTMAFFNPEKFTNEAVEKLKTELSDKAIIAASGGVDSTVAAVLAAKAVKDNLLAVYVNLRVGNWRIYYILSGFGLAREITRRIQSKRKELDLDLEASISLKVKANVVTRTSITI